MSLNFEKSSSSESEQEECEREALAHGFALQVGNTVASFTCITCHKLKYKECSCITLPTSEEFLFFGNYKNEKIPTIYFNASKITNDFPRLWDKTEGSIRLEKQHKMNTINTMKLTNFTTLQHRTSSRHSILRTFTDSPRSPSPDPPLNDDLINLNEIGTDSHMQTQNSYERSYPVPPIFLSLKLVQVIEICIYLMKMKLKIMTIKCVLCLKMVNV